MTVANFWQVTHVFLTSDTCLFNEAFTDIDTDHKFNKFVYDNFHIAEAQELILSRQSTWNNAVFHYVPIGEILKVVLSKADVLDNVSY
jgi:hypothetical protein